MVYCDVIGFILEDCACFMQVGRRYKITNPDKFRTFYGKMQFMLQDAQSQERSGLNLVKDIKARCRLDILMQQYFKSMLCNG